MGIEQWALRSKKRCRRLAMPPQSKIRRAGDGVEQGASLSVFVLRRQSDSGDGAFWGRRVAYGRSLVIQKAVSSLCYATAVQDASGWRWCGTGREADFAEWAGYFHENDGTAVSGHFRFQFSRFSLSRPVVPPSMLNVEC